MFPFGSCRFFLLTPKAAKWGQLQLFFSLSLIIFFLLYLVFFLSGLCPPAVLLSLLTTVTPLCSLGKGCSCSFISAVLCAHRQHWGGLRSPQEAQRIAGAQRCSGLRQEQAGRCHPPVPCTEMDSKSKAVHSPVPGLPKSTFNKVQLGSSGNSCFEALQPLWV